MRIKIKETFKEFHIKVFNTGKMEIPGIQNDEIFEEVLKNIIINLQPYVTEKLEYLQTSDTVLINSNFNCGFYINREVLFDILKFKYNIQCIYDPCSYPGIQCKFYFNPQLAVQTGSQISQEDKDNKKYNKIVEVSFMIFRTGSILIVGMCDEDVLYSIYEYLKTMLNAEFHKINQKLITAENRIVKDKKKKIRRKTILIAIQPV
jgi:TATA-box binding protein (TBP) (component of TFIID and TFIIIB)